MNPGQSFVGGMCFGTGFTFAAILVVAAMRKVFELGLCG